MRPEAWVAFLQAGAGSRGMNTHFNWDHVMVDTSPLNRARTWDQARVGFQGEHWVVLGAGLLLMTAAGRSRSLLKRTAGRALATALIGRAASGRDGVAGVLGRLTSRGAGEGNRTLV